MLLWASKVALVVKNLYGCTGKTMTLTIRPFVGKVISLLFKTLSRFDIAILPRSKHLLTSLSIML